ncbi:rCG45062 [Rattus norvegicus]|uniref:RCG45062 n=1 Tax=Rattus norvegicus TaxID=10116 RepID=A6KQY5_RAT|nr:rCG45062 [Rattus norvegicus]
MKVLKPTSTVTHLLQQGHISFLIMPLPGPSICKSPHRLLHLFSVVPLWLWESLCFCCARLKCVPGVTFLCKCYKCVLMKTC